MDHPVLLEMKGISKEFPGVKALDNVNLTVRAGTVHALMGENGAGKSTLMKCLFGIYNRDAGTITLDGKEIHFKSSKEALENGVAMVHQELNQALTRTVQDNLWLGRYPKVGGIMVSERIMAKRTREIFDTLEVSVNPKAVMSTLPVSQRQMVEIAKAVSYDSKIIVFDEPTSSLTETEVEHLFRIIDMLKKKGCGIIYISHKMDEILRISDDITVMRDGQWVATRPAKELTMEEIIKLMVGRELTNRFPPKTNKPGDVILDVQHIAGKYTRLKDATFQLRKGEVLGIAGLDGSGRTEVLENLFGAMTREGGTITLHGREIQNRTPKESIKNGFALLTEERRATGIFGIRDIRENTVISFQLRKGEVLGIAGLDGSGRTEVLENLFGAMTREGGTITLHGREIQNRTPKESIKNGFALLTEERRATGIFGIRDIRENTVISSLKDYLMGGICLSDKQMKDKTEWAIQAMHIKTPTQRTQIRSLSGGNQQKVIIGRWLLTKPEVLLLDEPTRGIDVGAKYEIYQLIIDLANEGKGVIMVSSEMPELLGVCDRILVMSGGQVAGEVDAANTSQEEILTLAAKYV